MKNTVLVLSILIFATTCCAQQAFDKNLKRTFNNRSYLRKTFIVSISVGVRSWYKNNISKADTFSAPNFSENLTPIYLKVERTLSNGFGLGLYAAYNRFNYSFYSSNSTTTYSNIVQVGAIGITGYYHFYKLVPVNYLDLYLAAGAGINLLRHSYFDEYIYPATTLELPDATTSEIIPVLRIGVRYFVDRHSAIMIEGGYDKLSIVNAGISFRF